MTDLRARLERTHQLAPTPPLPLEGVLLRRDRRRSHRRSAALAVAAAITIALLGALVEGTQFRGEPIPVHPGPRLTHNGAIDVFGYRGDGVGVLRTNGSLPTVMRCGIAGSCTVWSADWSVDGRLAYAACVCTSKDELPGSGIHTLDPATGSDTQITNSTSDQADIEVSWSPDGSKLAVVRSTGSRSSTLLIMDADGGSPVPLLREGATITSPTWSPDGSQIAYGDSKGRVFVINVHGGMRRQVARGSEPAWSPYGSEIVFLRGSDLYATSPMGGQSTRLASLRDVLGGAHESYSDIEWSPDGREIAVTIPYRAGVIVVKSNGGDPRAFPRHITSRFEAPFGLAWQPVP